jgi:photosystem II stability/assembly factor-like uncharacterized protein
MRTICMLGLLALSAITIPAQAVWEPQSPGTTTTFYGIAALNEQTAVTVGASGTILRTENAGVLWLPVTSGITTSLMAVYFADENHGWACGQSGVILATTDGGNSWSPQYSGITQFVYYVHFIDSLNGWACGQNGFVLHTSNGGALWEIQPTGSTMALWSIRFANALEGWTVGQSGTILYTSDGGLTWNPQVSGSSDYLQSVFCLNADTVFAVGGNGTILRTMDGGTTWTPCISGTNNWLYQCFFSDANHGWAVGRYGTVYVTSDGGESWSLQYETPSSSVVLRSVSMANSLVGWICGTAGTVLYTTNGGIVSPLEITLTPVNPPIQIPAGGGSFTYNLLIENISDSTIMFDGWIEAVLPNGNLYPILARENLSLPSSGTMQRAMTQNVPAGAPPGNYTYRASVGDYPDTPWDRSSFDFVKITGGDGVGYPDWNLDGWDPDNRAAGYLPLENALISAYPNPFNPRTRLEYTLPVTGHIRVQVLDLQGREVSLLVDREQTAGSYSLMFDGSHLPSGMYFYALTYGSRQIVGKMVLMK